MKKSTIKLLSISFFIMLSALFLHNNQLTVYALEYSGDCSYSKADNVKWHLDSNTGILTISGHGKIENYTINTDKDWHFIKSRIKRIIVKDGVTSLGTFCFYNCTSATKIILPDSLKNIDDYTFKNCKSLSNLTLPANVKTIGKYAFCDCRNFTSITIPNSVTKMGDGAFKDCIKLKQIALSSSLNELSSNLFLRCKKLTNVDVPKGVKTICPLVFKECSSLKSVTIPNSVTSIGSAAFEMCPSLSSIQLPAGITSISAQLFRGCKKLSTVKLPYTIKVIPSTAFADCPNVKIYCANNYVKDFAAKYKLKYINNGKKSNGLIYVVHNNNAIITSYTKDLAIANIPSKIDGHPVVQIWEYAFENCYTLTKVTIPSTVTSIEKNAFKYCFDVVEITNLSPIKISKGSEANGCAGFYAQNIRTKLSQKSILSTKNGFVFAIIDGKDYLIGYTGSSSTPKLPSSFTNAQNKKVTNYYIYKYAMAGRSSLKSFTVSSSVAFIGNNAFAYNPKLKNVIIPSSVNNIGSNAFIDVNKGFSIKGHLGSFAQTYAANNKLKFTAIYSSTP